MLRSQVLRVLRAQVCPLKGRHWAKVDEHMLKIRFCLTKTNEEDPLNTE